MQKGEHSRLDYHHSKSMQNSNMELLCARFAILHYRRVECSDSRGRTARSDSDALSAGGCLFEEKYFQFEIRRQT